MSARPPRVVAELGRPETPEETAARKAEERRKRRARQTLRNFLASLAVCLGLVLLIITLVPRGTPQTTAVDYRALAQRSEAEAGAPLLVPRVAEGWQANAAELRASGGVTSWYVGFVTPDNRFLAYSEGIEANETWLSNTLDAARPTGTTEIGGLTWRVYDRRELGDGAGNVAYGLATDIGTTYLAVYGTAEPGDAQALAAALAADADARGLTEGTP